MSHPMRAFDISPLPSCGDRSVVCIHSQQKFALVIATKNRKDAANQDDHNADPFHHRRKMMKNDTVPHHGKRNIKVSPYNHTQSIGMLDGVIFKGLRKNAQPPSGDQLDQIGGKYERMTHGLQNKSGDAKEGAIDHGIQAENERMLVLNLSHRDIDRGGKQCREHRHDESESKINIILTKSRIGKHHQASDAYHRSQCVHSSPILTQTEASIQQACPQWTGGKNSGGNGDIQ